MGIERLRYGDRKGVAWGWKGWSMVIERLKYGDRKSMGTERVGYVDKVGQSEFSSIKREI